MPIFAWQLKPDKVLQASSLDLYSAVWAAQHFMNMVMLLQDILIICAHMLELWAGLVVGYTCAHAHACAAFAYHSYE